MPLIIPVHRNLCPFIPHLCRLFLLAVAALFSIFLILAFSKVLYKWNHAICDLLDNIFPSQHYSLMTHINMSVVHSFLLLNSIPACVFASLLTRSPAEGHLARLQSFGNYKRSCCLLVRLFL